MDSDIASAETAAYNRAKNYTDDKLNTIVTYSDFNDLLNRVSGIDGGKRDDVGGKKHNERILALEDQVINDPQSGSNIKSNVAALLNEVNNAHRAVQSGQPVDTLALRFEDIEDRLDSLDGGEAGSESNSLVDIVTAIRSELNAAHREVEAGQPTDTIAARFSSIE